MRKWEYRILDSKDVGGGGIFKGKARSDVESYLSSQSAWAEICPSYGDLDGQIGG